ncbi:acetyl-CoA carboxylase biotin carboxylase subunit family protein [Rhodococcus sp. IEGM 1330]|uniref:ATP-grasp domain-containing protein n=1 Tax=Rhodococcus sp. IEGM 1330 TaxID=3082225 RepID=UPI0029532D28|nr:ATP-grasp domain-containing protein [Rhodococcus sp. IEGM 1330]MDV8022645.1 ATP-grasp domain-containing protein [Rhodococcus sp. IEGM 1330]
MAKVASTPASQFVSILGFSIDDDAATESILKSISQTSGLDAIVVFPENLQLCGARVRASEGIAGHREEWVQRFRDKDVMKSFARKAGLRCADSVPVDLRSEVAPLLARHGKVVVKPRDGAGSAGVHILDGPDDLALLPADIENHQAEEFIEGAMIHVDAAVQHGRVVVSVVSRYLDSTLSHTDGRPLGSVVSEDPRLRSDALSMLDSVVLGFEIDHAVVHLEAFVVDDGLVFNEIACRAGGGSIVETVTAHTGYNLMGSMIDLEMGVPLTSRNESVEPGCHGFVLFYAPPGIFDAVDTAEVPEDWIVRSRIGARSGQVVSPIGRAGGSICSFVVRGADEAEVEHRIRHMQKSVAVRMRSE